jgi:hypothetical protein
MEPNDLREDWIGMLAKTGYGNQSEKSSAGTSEQPMSVKPMDIPSTTQIRDRGLSPGGESRIPWGEFVPKRESP